MPPEKLGPGAHLDGDIGGTLAPQLKIAGDGTVLFDDVVGTGFALVVRSGSKASEHLTRGQIEGLTRMGGRIAEFGLPLPDHPEQVLEAAGNGAEELFAATQSVAVLVRPDFYIFGTASTPDAIGQLLDQAMAQTHVI